MTPAPPVTVCSIYLWCWPKCATIFHTVQYKMINTQLGILQFSFFPLPSIKNCCNTATQAYLDSRGATTMLCIVELCADELVVGGGVGWSYDRRRRRRRRQTGWESTETAHSLDRLFFWFYRGQPLHLWSLLGRWRRKVNCEYACCVQFHSRNKFLEAHINAMLSVEGTLM